MTRIEFAKVMAFLEVACGKSLSADAGEVYFEMLGDLDVKVLQIAAKRVVLEHRWATFPSVAELRAAAAETMRGQTTVLSPAEAWEIAWKAAGKIDLEMNGPHYSNGKEYPSQAAAVLDGLPPVVIEAMRSFGLPALCYGKEPVGVVRAQFTKIYEQLLARDQRLALIPPALKQSIEDASRQSLKAPNVMQIGRMPE